MTALVILNQQFAKHPDHPGVAHYLIHSNDFPLIAAQGLTAANCYAQIAPDAPHALHMPSHIFTRVGMWQQSVETNRRSVEAARRANGVTDQLHAYDYMIYADLQMARDQDAWRTVEAARSLAEENRAADYARAAIIARYVVERNAWREAAQLGDPDASKFPYTSAIRIFARALGAARAGDPDSASRDLARLADIETVLKAMKEDYWVAEVHVQELATRSWIAQAKGDRGQALSLMRAAADEEDLSEKSSVSPGRLIPARELLGDMLLEDGNAADALTEYEASLKRDPRRFRSYFGAGQAAVASANAGKARRYYALLVDMAGGGDPRPELATARDYLGGALEGIAWCLAVSIRNRNSDISPMPILETIHLEKRFGGIVATNDLSLAIEKGARHALIGPNGAGKTTVINLLTGVLAPTEGRIILDGKDITALPPHARVRLGMARTFQINQLFPDLTPLESIGQAISERMGTGAQWWRVIGSKSAVTEEIVDIWNVSG